jgi:acetyl coenzyme A synthetase (ADP forming)-like protein
MSVTTAAVGLTQRGIDVVLRDGTTAHVRTPRPGDAPGVRRMLQGLSEESRYLRFFSTAVDLSRAVAWATKVDHEHSDGLVVTTGPHERIVAHAGWERDPRRPERAEIALVIDDAFQGRGIGTLLLGQLAESARARGVELFTAEVLPGNHQMIGVFRQSGFAVRIRSLPGALNIEAPTLLTPDALERFDQREQQAAVAALRKVLAPGSVAVIGASRRRGTVGGELFHNLLAAGFTGPVYPVNPAAPVVQSVAAYPSIGKVPGPVDLAVLAVPAEEVVAVARECAAKGVAALVVISAGFAESGPQGVQRQEALLQVCRQAGMRLIGPNCLGVVNTDPAVRLDATFGPLLPNRGRVGFLSQSGALGLAIIDYANQLGLGLSSFVSVGNKADISGNDLLGYWRDDPDTELVLLYLESFGNPRKFARFASCLARSKPVVAVKAGRSVAGARATGSHTGALLAASDVGVDALFGQAGVIRTDTLSELFEVGKLLATQPAPAGRRVAIVTNAGGPGILCVDALEAAGLQVPALSAALRSRLATVLPAEAACGNPVDLLADTPPQRYQQAIGLVASSGEVDAVIVIHIPPLAGRHRAGQVAAAIHQAVEQAPAGLTFLAVMMRSGAAPAEFGGDSKPVPCYQFPEEAARALARAATRGEWLRQPQAHVPELAGIRRDEAAAVLAEALKGGPRWLTVAESARLLDCYGLPLAPWRQARSAQQARGVAELLVGVVHDATFGPVVACGAGGTSAELLGDVGVRLAPLTDRDAAQLLRSLKTSALLEGWRGAPAADLAALEDLLLRVGVLADNHPEIAELDCNPVVAGPDGAVIVDVRVRVEPAAPSLPLSGRWS